MHRRMQNPLCHLRAATNAVLGSLTGKMGVWRDKRRCKTCERYWSNFKDPHHNFICGMELARADCGGNTQGFLCLSWCLWKICLLMDVGLGCAEGGGKCSEEQRGEAQNGLDWKGT